MFESHAKLFVDEAPLAIVVYDRDGVVRFANARAARLFGFGPRELEGRRLESILPLGSERSQTGVRNDGSPLPVSVDVNAVAIDGAEFTIAAISGLSEERAAEERSRFFFEAAPSALIMSDESGRIALSNAQAEELFGYSRAELLGEPIEKLVPQRFRGLHAVQRNHFAEAPAVRKMGARRDLFGIRKDGVEIPVEIGLSPLRVGEKNFALAAVIDISERKRAEHLRLLNAEFGEHALAAVDLTRLKEEAAELIARMVGATYVRIGEIDADGAHVTYTSGVGWKTDARPVVPLEIARSAQATHSIRTGQPVLVERFDRSAFEPSADFEDRNVVGAATIPIRGKDAVVGLISIGTLEERKFSQDDVAFLLGVGTIVGMAIDRDRRERRIARLNEELQHRYDELEAFSYSVAHDLRTPLRSIAGFAAALDEDYGPTLDDEARRFLARIVGGAAQLSVLIDALLSLSRISRQELSEVDVDLSAIAETLVAELRSESPERQADVRIEPGLTVTGDPVLLRLVLQNLLNNAWKFTRERPVAHIALRRAGARGNTFVVEDDGVGFSTEYPEELFVPFKRLHGNDFEGTGIGLATVARIVRRHGGSIRAESAPDRGSRFVFSIGEDRA